MPSPPPRSVEVIHADSKSLAILAAQLGIKPKKKLKSSVSATLGLAGPSVTLQAEALVASHALEDLLALVVRELRKREDFSTSRPAAVDWYDHSQVPRFVHETCALTKFVIPVGQKLGPKISGGILVIWASSPEEPYTTRAWDPDESFLFLVDVADPLAGEYVPLVSGYTVFRVLLQEVLDRERLEREFGRDNAIHPFEILKSVGGFAIDRRRAECLYRIRTATDEVFFSSEIGRHRYNGIVGYPLVIAAR